MENNYKQTKTTVSMIEYYFVFCPQYRRKIFKIDGVAARFRELVEETCREHEIEIQELTCGLERVRMKVNVLPSMSPPEIMKIVKAATSKPLRDEFKGLSWMQSLWTRNYLVTTRKPEEDAVEWYVKSQKTR